MKNISIASVAAISVAAMLSGCATTQTIEDSVTGCQDNRTPKNPDWIYVDHGNGTVTDRRTGLMWKQCAEGLSGDRCQTGSVQRFNWVDANEHPKTSNFAGYSDWRLPDYRELESLQETCRRTPTINRNFFPNTPNSHFWTSRASHLPNSAWTVDFEYQQNSHREGRFWRHPIRLVRTSNTSQSGQHQDLRQAPRWPGTGSQPLRQP